MAFDGINGKFNKRIAPNAFGVKPVEVKDAKEVKEEAAPVVEFKGATEASALAALAAQSKANVGRSSYAQDIEACKNLAKLLPTGLNVEKYLTPLNVASVMQVTTGAQKALDEATTKTNAEALFKTPEFKMFEQMFGA